MAVYLPLGYNCIRELGGGGGGVRQNLSQSETGGFQSVCQPMLQHTDC